MTRKIDLHRLHMRTLAVGLPEHLIQGFRLGRELEFPLPPGIRQAWVTGMGGSAIAGDLVASVASSETDWRIGTLRGSSLPKPVGARDIVIAISYSGDTWETLSAYDEARRRGSHTIVLASGGELVRRADRDRVPAVLLPPDFPPRAALGFILGGILGILDPGLPESYEGRVMEAARRLAARQGALASADGGPARLARRVGRRSVTIVGPDDLEAVARRWSTQIEENAKRVAHALCLPEAMHNALVAWNALSRNEAARQAFVLFDRGSSSLPGAPDRAYLVALLRRRGAVAERLRWTSEGPLDRMLYGVSFGDHFSLFLAERAGIDPMDIHAIADWKRLAANRRGTRAKRL